MTGESETKMVGVFNSANRIITLKGVTKTNRRLKTPLLPKMLTLVPEAYLTKYKKNAVVQSLFDDEVLLTGRSAKRAERAEIPKEVKDSSADLSSKAAEEKAILSELSKEGDGESTEDESGE